MKNTLKSNHQFSDYPLKISETTMEDKIKMKQLTTVAKVIINAKIVSIRKDYRVHPNVSDPLNWDENWFSNYE